MIDFTNLPRRNKTYGGANGSKRSVIYQDEQYMLKFPPHPSRNRDMSYANSCLSEYLGCHIFALAGIMFMTGKGSFIAELHHQPLGVIGLLGMLVLFAPGLMPCSWKSVQEKTIWGTFLLLGGAMTMTTAMTQSGLAQWLAQWGYARHVFPATAMERPAAAPSGRELWGCLGRLPLGLLGAAAPQPPGTAQTARPVTAPSPAARFCGMARPSFPANGHKKRRRPEGQRLEKSGPTELTCSGSRRRPP